MRKDHINTISLFVSMYFETDLRVKHNGLVGQIWSTGFHLKTPARRFVMYDLSIGDL